MDEVEITIEEGEVTDDSEDNDIDAYNTLDRPAELINSYRPPVIETLDEDESEESSDSDSDAEFTANKPKRRKTPKQQPKRRNKYDIWSSRAHEDLLAETIVSCDVTEKDRSLGVESYKNAKKCIRGFKRRHDDKGNVHLRLGRRDSPETETKGDARHILDLCTSVDNTDEELAKDISNKLAEEKDDLILRVVKVLGKEKAILLFKETQQIEADGGLLIMNGTRRRTPGGVFIYTLKKDEHVPMDKTRQIFMEEKKMQHAEKKIKEKQRKQQLKKKIKDASQEKLCHLPTRAQLLTKDLQTKDVVSNPPPSPASEDSNVHQTDPNLLERGVKNYSDDFLEIGLDNDMDTF